MKIAAIKSVRTKLGKPNVLVTTIDGKQHWCPYGSWHAKGNSDALDAYVGGEFLFDYFQEGEELLSGDLATSSDVILRDFSASMSPLVVATIAAIGIQKQSEDMQIAAAMFRTRRLAAQALATKPDVVAEVTPAVVAGPVEA